MKTVIHVNQHNIKKNKTKPGLPLPVLTVKTYRANTYGYEVQINGPSKLVYRPNNPLSCGAQVWIEADSEDVLVDGIPL